MASIYEIHNAGMNLLNDLIGWDDVFIKLDNKKIPIKALISKNESAYERTNSVSSQDYKLCKFIIDDIVELNTSHSLNIPIPPSSLKNRNASIIVSNGNPYQIKNESTGSFNGRKMWVLEIERDN